MAQLTHCRGGLCCLTHGVFDAVEPACELARFPCISKMKDWCALHVALNHGGLHTSDL